MIVIENERLRLRWLRHADAPFLCRLLNDPAFLTHIGDKQVRRPGDAIRYLDEGPLGLCRDHGYGLYAIERKPDGALIGMAGLVRRAGLDGPDVGYALLPEYRGAGLAQAAVQLTLEHARRDCDLSRLLAIVSPENTASARVLVRSGFSETGTFTPAGENTALRLFSWSPAAPETVSQS